jgi:hypothetical protein
MANIKKKVISHVKSDIHDYKEEIDKDKKLLKYLKNGKRKTKNKNLSRKKSSKR